MIFPLTASPRDVEAHSSVLSGFQDRSDGTEGELKAINYIAGFLSENNIPYERLPLDSGDRGHSFSSNLIATIQGSRSERIIFAAPIDDGAYSTALLLELASDLKINPPKHTIILAFLGAERGETEFHPYGSRLAAEMFGGREDLFVIYLDSEVVPDLWRFQIGGNGTVSPYWLVEKTAQVISSEYIPYRMRGTDIHAARLGLQGDVGALASWLEAGIPSIRLAGEGKAEQGKEDRLITRFLTAMKTLDRDFDALPDEDERTYIFLRPLSSSAPKLIPELPYIGVFLAISVILLITPLFQLRKIRLNLKRFARFWWTWPLLFILVFLFLFLSTLIVEESILLANFPDLWKHAPGIFIFFKLAVTGALTLNFILITQGLPLPRSPHFYSYGAIFSSILFLLVLMALDVTMAFYALLVIIILLLFTISKNVQRKIPLLILAQLPYLIGAVVVVKEPYYPILQYMLLNRISANIILTLTLLPLIFGIVSLSYWRIHYQRIRLIIVTPAATLTLSLMAIITLIWILGLHPYGPGSPQPVILIDDIDLVKGSRKLELSSPGPVGDAVLSLDGIDYALEDIGRKAEIQTQPSIIPLKMEETSRTFLGRRTVAVTIRGDDAPSSLEISLHSLSPFTLHEANYPFGMSPSGTNAIIYLGANPPFPLDLRFTVNGDAKLVLRAVASWKNPIDPPSVNRTDLEDTIIRRARAEIRL